MFRSRVALLGLVFLFANSFLLAQKPRARDLGVPFEGTPGPLNAITDVKGVEVGHSTIIKGEGKLVRGQGPARTGVTAVWPRSKSLKQQAFAAWFTQNGNGEMTGTTWIKDSGFMMGPVMLTNTVSIGTVRDAYIQWILNRNKRKDLDPDAIDFLPVVAETWDGYLNDIGGFHVKPENAVEALESAKPGAVPEGNVGGGTGMVCFGFKGGIGTSSRKIGDYTVGVLVQCNCGRRPQLRIAGVPVGMEITEDIPYAANAPWAADDYGSIIIIVATDAPMLPHQLDRMARRATMGLARDGATSSNGSGDIFLAFSTANAENFSFEKNYSVNVMPNERLDSLFEATVQATEEAIVNAMVGAETMVGADNHKVIGLPHDRLQQVLKKYNRLAK